MSLQPILATQSLHKRYEMGFEHLPVLEGVDFSVYPGELVIVLGPSGSGKTTLLSLLAGLDAAYEGSVRLHDVELGQLPSTDRVALRNRIVGIVFQDCRLLSQLTALENVEAPLHLQTMSRKERHEKASAALALVGLADREHHHPEQMSGGERQRAAIARALVGGADLLLCDEPTGNLNRAMSIKVFELLKLLCREHGKTIVLATHDPIAAEYADRTVYLGDGRLLEQN